MISCFNRYICGAKKNIHYIIEKKKLPDYLIPEKMILDFEIFWNNKI